MEPLTDKTAIVTGASRGIGAATAIELAHQGAAVVLAARTLSEISAVAAEITDSGGKALALACDVSRYDHLVNVVDTAHSAFGSVDILVNNAGVIDPIGAMADSDPEDWAHAADINYKGVFFGMRAVLPRMKAQGSGTIISVSSGAAHAPLEGWAHYCSAKAAAAMLTRCVDLENRDAGICAIGLSPGTVATYMQTAIRASGINPVSKLDPDVHIPAEWPARAIAWLCGPEGADFAGREVSLRDEDICRRVGLI